ncbi:MAG: hypothetical protein E7357_01270 [Clostridiales bacterium]|nr:hypothetical protein [Clostridiales bacterium]
MVEFKIKNRNGEICRRCIRTSEIREIMETPDGTAKLRISDVDLNGDYVSFTVTDTYDEAKQKIEEEQNTHLSRLRKS